MAVKKKEKREIKGYKVPEKIYRRAMNRAKKDKLPLARQIETWVHWYSLGMQITGNQNDFIEVDNK